MNRIVFLFILFGASLFALDVENDIVARSQAYIGCAYRTGGTRPPEFDCSGFVGYIVRPYVPGLPRLSRDMADAGTPVPKDALLPGDLVFFATTEVPGAISHVALYLGNGSIVHAISDGPERGVRVTPLDARYWKKHYQCAVRVLPEAAVKIAAQPEEPAKQPKAAATAKVSAPKTPETSAKTPATVASAEKQSPWDTWNGFIKGDYDQWKEEQRRKLEAQESAYDASREMDAFETWKNSNGE